MRLDLRDAGKAAPCTPTTALSMGDQVSNRAALFEHDPTLRSPAATVLDQVRQAFERLPGSEDATCL